MELTKPPTRARTWTSSIASKRPVNSSQSVTVRLVGWATVTGGGGGAAACGAGLSPQPARATADGEDARQSTQGVEVEEAKSCAFDKLLAFSSASDGIPSLAHLPQEIAAVPPYPRATQDGLR